MLIRGSLLSGVLLLIVMVIFVSTLQMLQLCCIDITTVNDDAFQGLDSLRVLRLNSNNLTVGPSLQHIRHIKHLHLYRNFITKLPLEYFAGCDHLNTLYLDSNHLTSLPDMKHVAPSLKVMTLNGNKLVNLQEFENMLWPQLQSLAMADNFITDLEMRLLENTKALAQLDISHNELRTLPNLYRFKLSQNTSHKLEIQTTRNPWHCSESLLWVLEGTVDWDYMKFDVFLWLNDVAQMPCHTPSELKNTPLWDLGKFYFTTKAKCSFRKKSFSYMHN